MVAMAAALNAESGMERMGGSNPKTKDMRSSCKVALTKKQLKVRSANRRSKKARQVARNNK